MTNLDHLPERRAASDEVLEDFFGACGGYPRLQVEASDGSGAFERQRFERPFLLVGRSTECDIRCPHPDVSFRHAYLQYLDGAVVCLDLNSRTGTFARWGRFEAARFATDDVFSVGPYKIRLIGGDEPSRLNDTAPDGSASGVLICGEQIARNDLVVRSDSAYPQVHLELEDADGGPPLRHVVRRSVTLVGGWHGCDLRLKSRSVSRVHCSLVLTRHGLWAVDLLGRDGIQVNGQDVPFALLPDGGELRIGKYATVVRYGARPTTSAGEGQSGQANSRRRTKRRGRSGQVSEDLILALVSQFASMQQQMYDQNQQQMTLMLQMFGSLHRSQQELIRDDLDRVHELMREMQQLQGMLLLRDQQPGSAPPTLEQPTSKRLEAAPPKPTQVEPTPRAADAAAAAGPEPDSGPRPSGPPPVPVRRAEQTVAAEAAPDESLPPTPAAFAAPEPVAAKTANRESIGTSPAGTAPAADDHAVEERRARASRAEANDHGWLLQRMQVLEKERHGRWKKIMRALGGG